MHSGVISFRLVTGLSTDFVLIASLNFAWVLNCTASKSVTLYSVYFSVLSPQFAVGVALLAVLLSAQLHARYGTQVVIYIHYLQTLGLLQTSFNKSSKYQLFASAVSSKI